MEENIDIIKKAAGRVSGVGVEVEDVFSEVFIRLDKHLKLDDDSDYGIEALKGRAKSIRMYMGKVTYHVTSAMLKSSHVSTSLLAGGTSGSVRRMNYEDLKVAQEEYFARAKSTYSDHAIDANEMFGNSSFDKAIDFNQDLRTVLAGKALDVAILFSEGYNVREISEELNIEKPYIQNNLVPKIKNALTRMMGQDERSSR